MRLLGFASSGEGFGRNIAEAILLGVPVLATAFSGCIDFLAPEEGLNFNLRGVEPGQYPFGEGLLWAEPVVVDMAEKMQLVRTANRRRKGKERERLVLRARHLAESYAPHVTGRAFVARLAALHLISPSGGRGLPAVGVPPSSAKRYIDVSTAVT